MPVGEIFNVTPFLFSGFSANVSHWAKPTGSPRNEVSTQLVQLNIQLKVVKSKFPSLKYGRVMRGWDLLLIYFKSKGHIRVYILNRNQVVC